jgi:hypothetical protein
MGLHARDRTFLTDVAGTNWMQHFVTAGALVSMGARPADVVGTIKRHHDGELPFFSRTPLNTRTLRAQVQSLGALRIVQEYVATMETAGALFRAIRMREAEGGVLRSHHLCHPRDIRKFYEGILATKRQGIARRLHWPGLARVERDGSAELAGLARRLYPWLGERIKQLARQYVKGQPFRVVRMDRAVRRGRDPRSYGYVFVLVLEKGEKRPTRESSVIVQGLNKLKHGFNATVDYPTYAHRQNRGARRGITVMEVPKLWPAVNKMGQQVMLVAIMGREAARLTVAFDSEGLL